jgi:hypothetical protein
VTLRVLSVLTFLAGAGLFATTLTILGEGGGAPEARHLREMKEREWLPDRVLPVTQATVAGLPHGMTLARTAGIERRCVVLEGWNQRMLMAGDGDIHLEITGAPRLHSSPDTSYVTCEITPAWRAGHDGWNWESLVETFRPNRGGVTPWDSGPRRVRVTGWLLYDYQYDRRVSAWDLAHYSARVSGWELHPVTRLQVWDDARMAWAEVPR